jgi:hypothetical protein
MAGHSVPVSVTADWISYKLVSGNLTPVATVDTGFTGPVTLTSSDGQMKPVTIKFVNGHGVGSVVLTKVDTLTIDASAGTWVGTSNRITINPGIATHLDVLGPTVPVPVGEWNQIDVVALDAYGNRANTSGDVAISSNLSGVFISGPAVTNTPNSEVWMTNGSTVFFIAADRAETVTLHYNFPLLPMAVESITFE